MKLSNRIIITSPYKGKSKFPFFSKLKKNDELLLELDLEPPGRNGNSLYASYVEITNMSNVETFKASISRLNMYLDKLDYYESITPIN